MNSRGILCADHKVNHLSAAVRRATEPILTKVVAGNQSGAVKNKGGTEFPMLATRLFLQHATEQRKSAAVFLAIYVKPITVC